MIAGDNRAGAAADPLIREVEQFLFDEARLLDERRFDEWVDLFTDDAVYWVPNDNPDADPSTTSSLVHDGKAALRWRAKRLQHPAAHTQRPQPRTQHFVTNVQVEPLTPDSCRVRSSQLVYWLRNATVVHYPGFYEHTLRRHDGVWRIQAKKVVVLNANQSLAQLPVL
jgi:3-phenylpropionate/cinnamic acid dioxygenase small subunit